MASSSINLKLKLKSTSSKEINAILAENPIKTFILSFQAQRLFFTVRKESFINFELNKAKDTMLMEKVHKKRKGYYGLQLKNPEPDANGLKLERYMDRFFEGNRVSIEMKEGDSQVILRNNEAEISFALIKF